METIQLEQREKTLTKDQADNVIQILEHGDLFWSVKKYPLSVDKDLLSTKDNLSTPSYATVKLEGENKTYLGTVGQHYHIFQNGQLAELAVELASEYKLKIHNAGYTGNGEKVFIQLKLGETILEYRNGGTDKITRYLTLLNSHDGKGSLVFGLGNTTMSCSNQFNRFYKELDNRIIHSMSMEQKVEIAKNKVKDLMKQDQLMEVMIEEMNDRIITQDVMDEMLFSLTGVDMSKTPQENAEIHSSRKVNKLLEIAKCIDKEKSYKGDTLWGLFSGITRYTTHEQYKTMEAAEKSKISGSANRMDNKAYEIIMQQFV